VIASGLSVTALSQQPDVGVARLGPQTGTAGPSFPLQERWSRPTEKLLAYSSDAAEHSIDRVCGSS
jgi:hypothetical protein